MSDYEETTAEALARHRRDDAADYAALEAEAATHPPTNRCPIDECNVCGFVDCPNNNDAHYYKDGCPDCHGPKASPCASGHDYVNADDYTGNVFCSRCGDQQ